MRAREWTVAAINDDPTAHGIPELPTWRVERGETDGIAFAATDRDEPFIAAERPVRVRR
ncbi:hypothetical protein HPS36_03440 [Halorubrum salinarum]|uniref:Uncharacterized protein n=1 Tax=Halorubrum salinarum TaxID=2739057 RepID=A0A7D3YCM6_9EURY|nr:hypothetical protein [Halorubrum salinarum]QKG91948.1 hypothetical protein HPS36_03440 [Halorubrum salinarum]